MCPMLCDRMGCGPPGSSVHGVVQARMLEWVPISSPKGSSGFRDLTQISCGSCIADGFFTTEPPRKPFKLLVASCFCLFSSGLGHTLLFSSVQFSRVQLFVTPWTTAHQAYLSITNSQSLLKLMSNESVMPSNHLILCRPLLLMPSIFPSIRVFSKVSVLPIR